MSNQREQRASPAPLWVRLVFIALVAAASLVMLEVGARVGLRVREGPLNVVVRAPQRVALDLDEYEAPDPRHPNLWRLRPGWSATLGEMMDAKRRAGRSLAVAHYERRARELGIGPDDIVMRINAEGFRGPELDSQQSRMRILALGDSCTFGTLEDHTYPRVVERELERLGRPAEVVNGGVEGYGPDQLWLRIEEYTALQPDLVTLYIGWNALYGARPPGVGGHERSSGSSLASLRLLERVRVRALKAVRGRRAVALEALRKPIHWAPQTVEAAALDGWRAPFLERVEDVVDRLEASGARVTLLTLPGLFSTTQAPDEQALAMGHLPLFTDNAFVLARMSELYNEDLRRLARRRGLALIDLERWSFDALRPRSQWFFDSVHLTEEGQAKLGRFVAAELAPILDGTGEGTGTRLRQSP